MSIIHQFYVTFSLVGEPHAEINLVEVESDQDRVLYEFFSTSSKQRLGVQLMPDGTIEVGGWNAEGEWFRLVPVIFHPPGHMAVPFALDQYVDDSIDEHRYNSAPYCAKCGGPCVMEPGE